MAEVELADLLKYKEKVDIKSKSGKTIKSVWVRILGDDDLQRAYKMARVASAKTRMDLRTPGTEAYESEIAVVPNLYEIQQCKDVIKSAQSSVFVGEAYANIDREDLPTMDEIAVEPDAPTLEEQELYDKRVSELEVEYNTKIQQFIDDRLAALDSELSHKTNEELFTMTQLELSNIIALQSFQTEVVAQKIFRATYRDDKCTVRAYKTVGEFINSEGSIKQQLIDAYNELELSPDEVKN